MKSYKGYKLTSFKNNSIIFLTDIRMSVKCVLIVSIQLHMQVRAYEITLLQSVMI